MPIDPNIILQAQAPQVASPMDSMVKAMTLKELSQRSQMQDMQIASQQGIKQAFAKNLVQNPDGSTTLNKQGVLSDLYRVNPQSAMDYDKMFQDQDLQKMATQTALAKQLAFSISDPNSYAQVRQKAIQIGLPNAEQLPEQYDPKFVQNWQFHTLSGEEQLAQRMKQQELDIKKKGQDIELGKSFGFGNIPGALQPGAAPGGAAQPQAAGAAAPQSTDPATLVKYYVPEKHQEKAFSEIEAAQNTKQNSGNILSAFDNAAKNFHGVDVVPGIENADQKSLHALLGPTFKDVEGTVRQAAMDNMFKNITPQFGDDKETLEKKRAALVGYLQSKASAPTAKGFGIDLNNFPSTALKNVGQPQGGVVNMKAPDGSIRAVPADQVEAAKQAGGVQI